ncbi:GlcNAc-PI de-N-acetylase [Arcticibacter pallidicorallinus]|uniref:GlcNAc-PI de-N-acetylase n=2 Tax=Arcticibacter pallidicorallinus TaxID=1259464 RepID=A0A2T0U3T3_9SPHI|nr:GlcNAc-PI de-N-acetylase [Arcticibacter pallidicorallinus]
MGISIIFFTDIAWLGIIEGIKFTPLLHHKMKLIFLVCNFLLCSSLALGQTSVQLSSSEIKLGIEKLAVTGSVLYIAAHPDDENTRLLSYLATERKVRTGYLSLTRGDGGQNLIGTEQAEELGLIRTQELLAARSIDGAEQFFTRANDFGFSKTSEETFKIWNRDSILSDVVWVIRNFRPDVIITRFPPDARAGHGHHSASAILAIEAFKAAADPAAFPEQLSYVKPWKSHRILWNTFNFGGNNTTSEDQLKINVGQYNTLLGQSYGEIASESRSQHKSQGFGVAKQRGESFEYFELLAGQPAKKDLLDGREANWVAGPNGAAIAKLVTEINREYRIEAPEKSVPALLRLYELISGVQDEMLKKLKMAEVADLILATSGTWFEVYASEPAYSITDSIPLRVQAISRYQDGAAVVPFISGKSEQKLSLSYNRMESLEGSVKASRLSQPYWLEHAHPIGEYKISNRKDIGMAESAAPLVIRIDLHIQGQKISYSRPAVYKFTDPVRGEVYRKLEVTPPVVVALQSSRLLYTGDEARPLEVKLKSFSRAAKGDLRLKLPSGWTSSPKSLPYEMTSKGEERMFRFTVKPGQSALSGQLTAELNAGGSTWSKAMSSIQYDHIPTTTWFPEAAMNLVRLQAKKAGNKIGYIPGAGDLIPESLKQLGYEVVMLNAGSLDNVDLSSFDAIVAGIRLYNVSPAIKYINDKLLKYVENGGVLLVQYNVSQPLMLNDIGPYPFSITRNRVTEEDATVNILNPAHRIFNYPNKITARDFDGWVQERGLYFGGSIDPRYQSLLSMRDTGEAENTGALFVADYGKGRFVYTGLSFFRQLPAGVPGAYRLFVNLISH